MSTVEASLDADLIWRQKVVGDPAPPPGPCDCTFSVSLANIGMPASLTVGNGALATVVPLQQTPATRYPAVYVNGVEIDVGGLTASCYFSGNGGVTARTLGPLGNVQAGDLLYWNGLIAGWQLATTDRVTLEYFYTS
jgi:hypothetical protein